MARSRWVDVTCCAASGTAAREFTQPHELTGDNQPRRHRNTEILCVLCRCDSFSLCSPPPLRRLFGPLLVPRLVPTIRRCAARNVTERRRERGCVDLQRIARFDRAPPRFSESAPQLATGQQPSELL